MLYNFIIVSLLVCMNILFSKVITGEYVYNYGDSENLLQARNTCKKLAIRNALEGFAVYMDSKTEIKNYVTEKDEIISISEGIIQKVKIVDKTEDKYNNLISMTISGEVDEDKVIKRLENSAKERKNKKSSNKSNTKPKLTWKKYSEVDLGYLKVVMFSRKEYHCYKIAFDALDYFISEKSRSGIIYQYKTGKWKIKQAGLDKIFRSKQEAIQGLFKKLKLGKDIRDYIIKR